MERHFLSIPVKSSTGGEVDPAEVIFVFSVGRLASGALILQLLTPSKTLPGPYVLQSLVPTRLDPESFARRCR